MNRKQRRAQEKVASKAAILSPSSGGTIAQMLGAAIHHHQGGRLVEAEALYRRILTADARHADALHLLGVIAHQVGRPDSAVDLIGQAIAINGTAPAYYWNRGAALKALGRLDDALAACDAALRIKPDLADAHYNRGNALQDLGRPNEALAAYDAALRIKPDYAEAHANRGSTLKDLGRPAEALAAYDSALRIRPDLAEARSNRGSALKDLGRLNEALAAYDAALRIKPDLAEAHYNRGNALKDLGRLNEALAAYAAALRIRPEHAEAHANRGNALKDLGRLAEALAACDAALRVKPDYAEAHYNRGLVKLLSGHFADGWRGYEYRWHIKALQGGKRRHEDVPAWRGEPADGRTILLWAEQGFGDAIQFVRYVTMVAQLGWRVVLEVPAALAGLFAGIAGARVVPIGEALPFFDVQCPLLGLPLVFATTVETIPAPGPYLAAKPDAVAMWSSRLPRDGLRVGIAWQGNPAHGNDRNRSFRLEQFSRLAALPGVHLISLQKEAGVDQLAGLSVDVAVHTLGADYDGGDFLTTAAVVAALDLVIGPDTSVVHLAGALGRPVWMALPAVPDWRWLTGREDSPWYPTMRLFRQTKPRDWDGVFARIAEELRSAKPV